MDHLHRSMVTEKENRAEEPGRVGTLYTLASNLPEHFIALYSPVSEFPREAAERFWKMHQNPLAAGGYAGQFTRANAGLCFSVEEKVQPQFEYRLEHHDHLRVLEYGLHNPAGTLLFAGWWYEWVNQHAIQREHLHRAPTLALEDFQIVTLSVLQQQIQALSYFHEHPGCSERFEAYLAFIEALKARPLIPSVSGSVLGGNYG